MQKVVTGTKRCECPQTATEQPCVSDESYGAVHISPCCFKGGGCLQPRRSPAIRTFGHSQAGRLGTELSEGEADALRL